MSTMLLGFWAFIFGLYTSVTELEARMTVIEDSEETLEKKIDEIHWYLIKRNNVKVPRE